MNPLVTIGLRFFVLSFFAVGGVSSVLPEMHRITVEVNHWMNDAEFTDLYALAQASPGPNMLIVTLIGWQVAGLPGALVATAATCVPPSVLTYFVERAWSRARGTLWQRAVESGLAPITVGLVLSTGWLLARGSHTGWRAALLTAATAITVALTRVNPLWLFVAAAALGLAGLV